MKLSQKDQGIEMQYDLENPYSRILEHGNICCRISDTATHWIAPREGGGVLPVEKFRINSKLSIN